jgi:hypothetical protein
LQLASGRDIPWAFPRAERALPGEKVKFLALQFEQNPDLLTNGQLGLPAMPLSLSRE